MFALSWRARLFAAYVLCVAAALALATFLVARAERDWLLRQDGEALERVARHVAADLRLSGAPASGGQDRAQALAGELGYRVTLIDSLGRVVGDSDVPRGRLATVENHRDRPEVRAALAGGIGRSVRHSATVGVDFLYLGAPVAGAPGVAVVRLAKPLAQVARLQASLTRLSVTAALLTLAVLGVVLFWLSGLQARRVGHLARVARRLGAGDLSVRARELPEDELGRLGRTMNEMAAELRSRLQALEQERDRRERMLAHLSDGVALVDRAGRVEHANRSLAAILGAALPPAPGTTFDAFARSPELSGLLAEAWRSSSPAEREVRVWNPAERIVHATATRVGGEHDGIVLLVLHDLTEAERLDRVRRDFVANVSHELRTPLTSVRGYAETLLEGGLEDAERRVEFVRVIRDQAVRLQRIVDDLLALARLERPEARVRREPFDLRELAERQVASFRARAGTAGLSLALEPGPPTPVHADRGLLEQVLANLLDNAVKYAERGRIMVRVGLGPDGASWGEVEDTGAGIPADDLPRVFERFYRVDKARSREKGGTGLGLAIVKHVIELHGGSVSARSDPGRGSCFRFEIPAPDPGTA